MKEFIEIPFGAKDSELCGWEYTIPKGFVASIENGKIIVKKEEGEDEKIRKALIDYFDDANKVDENPLQLYGIHTDKVLAWLEKQKTSEEALQYLKENHSSSELSDFQAAVNIAVAKAYDKGYNDALEKQGESSDKIHYWTEEEIEPIISDYLRGAEHYGGMISRLRCLKPKSLEKQGEQKSQRIISAEAKEAMYDNPAWNEDDEEFLRRAIKATTDVYPVTADWLKSLKERLHPQWKPSEEQIQALEYQVNSTCKGSWQYKASKELLEQLKKL